MLPHLHLLIGGIISIIISIVGSILNTLTLYVLLSVKSLRNNSTTILIIFLTITNLIYTTLVLPLNSLVMLRPEYPEHHLHLCSLFSLLFYWNFAALLFVQAALAVNRWAAVCTTKYR